MYTACNLASITCTDYKDDKDMRESHHSAVSSTKSSQLGQLSPMENAPNRHTYRLYNVLIISVRHASASLLATCSCSKISELRSIKIFPIWLCLCMREQCSPSPTYRAPGARARANQPQPQASQLGTMNILLHGVPSDTFSDILEGVCEVRGEEVDKSFVD